MKKSKLLTLVCIAMLCVTLCLTLYVCSDSNNTGNSGNSQTTSPNQGAGSSQTTSPNQGAGITDDGLIWVKGEDGVYITGYFGITEDLVIPASIQNTPVVAIGNSTFQSNVILKTITIPDSVTTIGDSTFYNCSNLTSVTIGNSVTTIGNYAFYNCDGMTSIVIPDSVTTIGDYAFAGCNPLTSITIPDSVTTIGNDAFSGCSNLSAVYITDAGAWCSIHFANYAANPLYYAKNLYLNGELISDVVIPDGVTTIPDYAFYYTTLTSIVIPDSVTTIGSSAFRNCSKLTSITIGNSVTSIGDYAFLNCSKLQNVYYTGTAEQWAQISIGSYNSKITDATIHYNYIPEE